MTAPQLYFNPRCSKARSARDLLDERGVQYELVSYLVTPPTRDELAALAAKLEGPPVQLVRVGDARFRELGLEADALADADAVVDLLAAHPELLERPVLVVGDRAVIGRPPERVLEIL